MARGTKRRAGRPPGTDTGTVARRSERTGGRSDLAPAAIGTGCGRGTVRAPHDLRSDAGRTSAAKHQTPRVRMRVYLVDGFEIEYM